MRLTPERDVHEHDGLAFAWARHRRELTTHRGGLAVYGPAVVSSVV